MAPENESYLSRVARAARRIFNPSTVQVDDLLTEQRLRAAKYEENWENYRGTTLLNMVDEDGRPHKPVNLLKKNIDKINYFAFGRGFNLINEEYTDWLQVAMAAWGTHLVEDLTKMGQFGSVCGDAYIMVAPTNVTDALSEYMGDAISHSPTGDTVLSIVVLDPKYCTPVYHSFDPKRLIGATIDIPTRRLNSNGEWVTEYQRIAISESVVFTQSLNINGTPIAGTKQDFANSIGKVYIHHIRNYPDGGSVYGADDVTDVAALNKELSKEINSVSNILEYSGDPITLIFGARAKNLTKGPNKIWGGLPKDAKVENLSLNTDLIAATNNIAKLTETLYALMGVPEIANGTNQAISNTSGVALHTMYMPLLERSDIKHRLYGPHLIEVVITIIRWLQALNIKVPGTGVDGRKGKLSEEDYAKIRQDTRISFTSVLPKDRLVEAQIQSTLLGAHLQTREDALVALGDPHPSVKLKKIDAEFKHMVKEGLHEAHALSSKAGTLESGMSANAGETKTDSGAQKGAPKTSKGAKGSTSGSK